MTDAIQTQRRRLYFSEVSRVAPGLYSWLATVLTPALPRGSSLAARAFALLALGALVGAVALTRSRPRLGRLFGVYGFVASCFGAWACLGPVLRSDQLDPVRGALGGVGFLLHALAWGSPARELDAEAPDNLVAGTPLLPRHRPVRGASLLLGGGITLALIPAALAFAVERQTASLLAHATALGCALLLIAASAELAVRAGKPRQLPAWRARASRAAWALGGLTLALGVGLLWLALH